MDPLNDLQILKLGIQSIPNTKVPKDIKTVFSQLSPFQQSFYFFVLLCHPNLCEIPYYFRLILFLLAIGSQEIFIANTA